MLNQLKKHYHKFLTTEITQQNGYLWFVTNDGEPFGLKQSQIPESEIHLLKTLFNEYRNEEISYSPRQQKWKSYLNGEKHEYGDVFYRFIHFFSRQPILDYPSFAEAVMGLFPENAVLLLNEDFKTGVIIETSKQETSDTPYGALRDTLSTDFYIDLSIFIGSFNNKLELAQKTYQVEQEQFLTVKNNLQPKSVYTAADVIPLLLLQTASPITEYTLMTLLAEWSEEDKELLYSIKVFVECNMNISLAAKKLYIHRNSLQYRVDKFLDKTGIDVKQFKDALTVYMAILYLEQKTNS
jgi:DNA-binding PucR family transcriptional regulator